MSAAELARITAAITAEISRHSAEATMHLEAAESLEAQDCDEEAWLHNEDARHHIEASERLLAILHPDADPKDEEEILF